MQLSRRLSAIAEMVTAGNRVADVGCDHGYLPVALLLEGKIPGAIAMDVKRGPLSSAREHITEFGLEAYIETRLSDGLHALKPGEVQTVVIAGMGGPLMERLLEEGQAVVDSLSELILQPQSDLPHFRRFLKQKGLKIAEERIILEDGKYYFPMRVIPASTNAISGTGEVLSDTVKAIPDTMEEWTETELNFGRTLLLEKNPLLLQYLNWKKGINEEIKRKLSDTAGEAGRKRLAEVKEEEQLLTAALAYYEM